MLHENEGFVPLPHEKIVYSSPPRTSLSLQPVNPHSGNDPFSVQSSSGCVHLTNQRIVYLPMQSTSQFDSFSAPLLNLQDTHVSAPFFGPNVWTALVQPVAGGGISPSVVTLQLKMTFKDGGAFDFHSNFERIKERLQQAVEHVREAGLMTGNESQTGIGRQNRALDAVNFSTVHLDELPAYDGPGTSPVTTSVGTLPQDQDVECSSWRSGNSSSSPDGTARGERLDAPSEPPPGYEEVQQQTVADALERRLRSSR